jgi:hypothetical protein
MNIIETLKKLSDEQRIRKYKKPSGNIGTNIDRNVPKQDTEQVTKQKRKDPSYIYLDKDNEIKEIPLSKLDLLVL